MARAFVLTTSWIVGAAAFLACNRAAAPDVARADARYDLGESRALRVLYAGALKTERAAAFLAFLRANFATVDALDLRQLDAAKASRCDVVVADWKRRWSSDGILEKYEWPELHLGEGFRKPIVMVASAGCSIQQHTKIGML